MTGVVAVLLVACVNPEIINPHTGPTPRLPLPVIVEKWQPLAIDGLHDMAALRDPSNPASQILQEPSDGLANLPASPGGNWVNWVKALVNGEISPRRAKSAVGSGIEAEELVMDMDIMLDLNGSMNMVLFPHRAHTLWLACSNCHPAIFLPQKGANRISMEMILMGEQCGKCHGAVAFPPTDCSRCHSVPHLTPAGKPVPETGRNPW